MVQGKQKSRSKRRVYTRVPSGNVKKVQKQRKNAPINCSECGKRLPGIPRLIASKFRKLAKTKKRASRPHPNLCSKCMRNKIRETI